MKNLLTTQIQLMKYRLIKIFLFSVLFSAGQNFTHSLSITSKQNGLQALAVGVELKNLASTAFTDVRIFDKSNNEVPYFLVTESFNYSSTNFKEYQVTDKQIGKGRYTSFIVQNPNKEAMQNIVLCVANSDALKVCNITGSDDKKQWYSVSDHIFLYHLFDENSVNAYRTMMFPMVNYKYLKIEINDLYTLPLNILKVGYFEGAISAGKLNDVKPANYEYSNNKKKKISLIHFKFENPTILNRLSFKIKSPNYYKRLAHVFVNRTKTVKNKEEIYRDVLAQFELNSNNQNLFDLISFREKEFFIEINNEDNPPLEIDTLELKQLQTYLVADFKNGETYTLKVGDKNLNTPRYDIEFFKNKISQYLPTLEVSDLKPIPSLVATSIVPVSKPFWQEAWFLWICIALASFVLFLFSLRILKDMKK